MYLYSHTHRKFPTKVAEISRLDAYREQLFKLQQFFFQNIFFPKHFLKASFCCFHFTRITYLHFEIQLLPESLVALIMLKMWALLRGYKAWILCHISYVKHMLWNFPILFNAWVVRVEDGVYIVFKSKQPVLEKNKHEHLQWGKKKSTSYATTWLFLCGSMTHFKKWLINLGRGSL